MKISNIEYGWDNGKLILERIPLTKAEKKLLNEITEVTYREMAERTRGGSGDDQAYVDEAYKQMKRDKRSKEVIHIVFRIMSKLFNDETINESLYRLYREEMGTSIMDEDHKFHKIYPNIPLNERENICCLVDDEPISWKLAKMYIDQKSDIGKKILENLKKIKVI